MKTYDAIITVGNGFSKDWHLPSEMIPRMKYVSDLYFQKISNTIIVSGKWSIDWELNGIIPPTTEAEVMKKVLMGLGIPDKSILKEEWSEDSIGNAYFSKTHILEPYNFKTILIVCSDLHLKRTKFLFDKILGEAYEKDYQSISLHGIKRDKLLNIQDEIMHAQQVFLKDMRDGEDTFLDNKLYADPYYKEIKVEKGSLNAMRGFGSDLD